MASLIHNPNCDGAHCSFVHGEVRKLPAGGDSNMILCANCFRHEIRYRRERNEGLSKQNRFALPAWEELQVYDGC